MKSYFLLAIVTLSTTNLYSADELHAAAANAGANRARHLIPIQYEQGVHVWVANYQPGLPKKMDIDDDDDDTEMPDA